jgi:hypothetical protein
LFDDRNRAKLSDLPADTFGLIAQHLPLASLAALVRSCKTLKHLLKPSSVAWKHSMEFTYPDDGTSQSLLVQFVYNPLKVLILIEIVARVAKLIEQDVALVRQEFMDTDPLILKKFFAMSSSLLYLLFLNCVCCL